MIIFHARQLRRILIEFLDYYHRGRPHKALEDDSPDGRAIQGDQDQKNVAIPVLSGLHHYTRQAA